MQLSDMSKSGREVILAGWLRSHKSNPNQVVRNAAQAFPQFGNMMSRNLRLMRDDEAFQKTMKDIFRAFDGQPVKRIVKGQRKQAHRGHDMGRLGDLLTHLSR